MQRHSNIVGLILDINNANICQHLIDNVLKNI